MKVDIQQAAALLRSGNVVAFPTETVYGLGANALDAAAVMKIYAAKERPLSSPLIVHCPDIATVRGLAAEWPPRAQQLADAFWPGPLTIIVPKAAVVPDVVTAGHPSVGLRIPAHPVALELLRLCCLPLAAPSANKFMALSATTAAHVDAAFPDLPVLDGGPCTVGIESTVISFAGPQARILRPGMISRLQIESVIGPVTEGAGAESPGQHPKHYSPRTRVILGDPPSAGHGFHLTQAGMPATAGEYAEVLYSILHDLDDGGYDWIAVELPPDLPEWSGVRDRLFRAGA